MKELLGLSTLEAETSTGASGPLSFADIQLNSNYLTLFLDTF